MDSRSSRLLSGRRVPSRHSARFISRSALAMAIDALRLPMVLTDDDRTAPRWRGKSRGPMPGQAWAPGDRVRSRRRSVRDEVDHEDQGLARLDRRGRALVAVGEVGGDGQLATAADLHALHTQVPALDDTA